MIPNLTTAWFSAQQPTLSFLELLTTYEGKWQYRIVMHVATNGAVYDKFQ